MISMKINLKNNMNNSTKKKALKATTTSNKSLTTSRQLINKWTNFQILQNRSVYMNSHKISIALSK